MEVPQRSDRASIQSSIRGSATDLQRDLAKASANTAPPLATKASASTISPTGKRGSAATTIQPPAARTSVGSVSPVSNAGGAGNAAASVARGSVGNMSSVSAKGGAPSVAPPQSVAKTSIGGASIAAPSIAPPKSVAKTSIGGASVAAPSIAPPKSVAKTSIGGASVAAPSIAPPGSVAKTSIGGASVPPMSVKRSVGEASAAAQSKRGSIGQETVASKGPAGSIKQSVVGMVSEKGSKKGSTGSVAMSQKLADNKSVAGSIQGSIAEGAKPSVAGSVKGSQKGSFSAQSMAPSVKNPLGVDDGSMLQDAQGYRPSLSVSRKSLKSKKGSQASAGMYITPYSTNGEMGGEGGAFLQPEAMGQVAELMPEIQGEGEIPGEFAAPPMPEDMDMDPCAEFCADNLCDDDEDDEEDDEIECIQEEIKPNYKLNDFLRAKQYFMTKSPVTGVSLYDHLSELIRKLLDNRSPDNPVDYFEEFSLNLKRYRFGMPKDLIQDSYFISPHLINEAEGFIRHWKKHAQWSKAAKVVAEDDTKTYGGFPNLLRLLYYLEQTNVGLPREEMFKIALMLREIQNRYPTLPRIRFWGKIFALKNNYYIFESELDGKELLPDTFVPLPITPPRKSQYEEDPYFSIPGAGATFERAGNAVTDPEIVQMFQQRNAEGSPVPPNTARPGEIAGERIPLFQGADEEEDLSKWQEYQMEMMTGFPIAKQEERKEVPPEEVGKGLNRRQFFAVVEPVDARIRPESVEIPNAWDNLRVYDEDNTGLKVIPLGPVTPQQINVSRIVRWFLTGDLNAKVNTVPDFPGREADYLRALLARITAATAVSPKGYYRGKKDEEELGEDDEDVEDEEDEEYGVVGDLVYPRLKFRVADTESMTSLELWVHHASYILRQGRTVWFDMTPKRNMEELGGEDEEMGEDEEEEEGAANKEFGPGMFTRLADDKAMDGSNPWAIASSSSIFTEFQVAYVRSNLWPGAHAMCTMKGKVENIYFGDGLKFNPRSYAPFLPEEPQQEYKDGPEIKEMDDPSVQAEQEWLAKLQLSEIADIEPKFVDNEVGGEGEEEEDDDDDEEDD